MSATPRPWGLHGPDLLGATGRDIIGGDHNGDGYFVEDEDAALIVTAVNAFAALLAVAQAVAARNFDYVIERAVANLDTQHPGWREWTP